MKKILIFIIVIKSTFTSAFSRDNDEFQKILDESLSKISMESYSKESLTRLVRLRWKKKESPEGVVNIDKLVSKAKVLSYLGVPADILLTDIFGEDYFLKEKATICKEELYENCFKNAILKFYTLKDLKVIFKNNSRLFEDNPMLISALINTFGLKKIKSLEVANSSLVHDIILTENTKDRSDKINILAKKIKNRKAYDKYCLNPNFLNFYKSNNFHLLIEKCSKNGGLPINN